MVGMAKYLRAHISQVCGLGAFPILSCGTTLSRRLPVSFPKQACRAICAAKSIACPNINNILYCKNCHFSDTGKPKIFASRKSERMENKLGVLLNSKCPPHLDGFSVRTIF